MLCLLALLLTPPAAAEELTLTTYYPSPRGVYRELRTTNNTLLAQQGGGVAIGTSLTTLGPLTVTGTPSPLPWAFCPSSYDWYDENGNGVLDARECKPTGLVVTPGGQVLIGARRAAIANARLTVAGSGSNPDSPTTCPSGTDWYDENDDSVRDNGECRPTILFSTNNGVVALGTAAAVPIGFRLFVRGNPGGVATPDATTPMRTLALAPPAAGFPTGLSLITSANQVQASLGLAGTTDQLSTGTAVGDVALAVQRGGRLLVGTSPDATPATTRLVVTNAGNVGIGTATPQAPLEVNGPVLPGRLNADPAPAVEGMVYYNTSEQRFKGYQNGQWQPLGLTVVDLGVALSADVARNITNGQPWTLIMLVGGGATSGDEHAVGGFIMNQGASAVAAGYTYTTTARRWTLREAGVINTSLDCTRPSGDTWCAVHSGNDIILKTLYSSVSYAIVR